MQLAHVDKNTVRGIYNHAQYISQRSKMMQIYSEIVTRNIFLENNFMNPNIKII